jgi:hypothetical protein
MIPTARVKDTFRFSNRCIDVQRQSLQSPVDFNGEAVLKFQNIDSSTYLEVGGQDTYPCGGRLAYLHHVSLRVVTGNIMGTLCPGV